MSTQPSHHLGRDLSRSKYRLLGLVGQGQFGRVFCAVHRQTGELVALKSLERDRFPTHKFLRELRFLLSLQHPNIVMCKALEHTPTGRCLVMDYCEAGTLRSLMDEEIRLALPQSLKLVADILAGLEHAHSHDIIHCDIKPENILLHVQPYGWTAKISDFGIARLSQDAAAAAADQGNTGSPAYMAPERFYGQYSKASDIYSVGVLLFELLAGHRPFSGTPTELMSAHLNQSVKVPESIPKIWHPIIIQALQKLAARRFSSAGAMLTAMRQVAAIAAYPSWLDPSTPPSTSQMPLLQPIAQLFSSPFRATAQYPLPHFCNRLATVPDVCQSTLQPLPQQVEVYAGGATRVMWQSYLTTEEVSPVEASPVEASPVEASPVAIHEGTALESDRPEPSKQFRQAGQSVTLPFEINELVVRPQGCFAIANRAVYLLTLAAAGSVGLQCQAIATVASHDVVAIEAEGRWLATATETLDGKPGVLQFFPLPNASPVGWLTPHPIGLTKAGLTNSGLSSPKDYSQPLRLIALNARQVALFSSLPNAVSGSSHNTQLTQVRTSVDVFTRRGDRLIRLRLPVRLGQIIATAVPYRLLATDQNDPHALLMIDLKPFRITRLGLELAPQVLAATSWGYMVADSQGQMLFLDKHGQRVGRVDCPASVTAIAPFHAHGVLVTTQEGDRCTLYVLDLKQLSVDLMF